MHRGALPADEVRLLSGIPTTAAERTLLDLSAGAGEKKLRRLVKQAEFHGHVDSASLAAILARYPRRRGRKALARIVGSYLLGNRRTRSELEDAFLSFCGQRDLPLPETNAVLEAGGQSFEVDCAWRVERLVVELDGGKAHDTDTAFQDDRARDRALMAAGWSPMRVTWAHLRDDADTLALEIRTALARTSADLLTREVSNPTFVGP